MRLKTRESGRIHPLLLGAMVLIAGLFFHQSWWQLGAILVIAVFVDACFRYRTLN